MRKPIRSLLVVLFLTAAFAQAPPELRLGRAVEPVQYGADLTVLPAGDTFDGVIDIALKVHESTPLIWLNATELTIREASLKAGERTLAARVVPGGADFAGFAFDQDVPAGEAVLHIVYSGKISARTSGGIFRNQVAGAWYAFTQFEAIDARRAFPCFDEPSFKTPWQIVLHVKREHMALSNTPVISETDEPAGMKAVRFARTRPLPSYLVAFAVGPFDAVDAGHAGANKTPLRIITPRGLADQAKYAAEVTAQLLNTLEDYFGIPYPYEKLDSIAVPLFGGAMENPGLITYGQTLILAKPSEDSLQRQRSYASVSAHEMAHQWTGDLVTAAWWDDIWLNEAFATWMSAKVLEKWKPEWHEEISAAASTQSAMAADSLVSARRIRQPIESNGDIANAFDSITYEKGAAVISMFEHWLTPEVFRAGVRRYLNEHAYGNATAADFLAAVSAAAGRDVAPAFSTFLDQPGVPLVSGEVKCGQGGEGARLALAQRRFLPLGSPAVPNQLWQIPVCVRYANPGQGSFCTLLAEASASVALPAGQPCPSRVVLNDGGAGYYRALYRGSTAGGDKDLSPVERVGIVGDATALFRGGELPASDALRTAARFANDPMPEVVSTTIAIVSEAGYNLAPPDLKPNYERFVRKVYGPRAHELGWTPKPGEGDDARFLRSELVQFVANDGADAVLSAEAVRLASKWLDDRSGIAPGMLTVVLETAAAHGDRPLYERMAAALAKTTDPAERQALIAGMAAFSDPAIIKANFGLLLDGAVDLREARGLMLGPLRDPRTRAIPFELVRDNYDQLASKVPGSFRGEFSARLPRVGSAFCDEKHRAEVEAFFKDRSAKATGGARILAQTLESIDQCIAIRQAQEPSVAEFLKGY
jgi:alanyl aminopeptidase